MSPKINNSIKWSMLELRGLVEDEDLRVYYQRATRHLGLHPFHLNDLNTAIREILSSTINFYDKELQGLVLIYKNPKLISSLGGILHDSHFIHVDVVADFYVFKPEIGCTLKGIINKKAENHVGVLVHKTFNVSIPKSEESEEWLGDSVYVGQEVRFTVTHLDFKGKLPFIRGNLLADGIDVANHGVPVGCTNGEQVDTKLGRWQDSVTTKLAPESRKKHSKKSTEVVDSSGDDLSDSDNKLGVFRKKEKSKEVKKAVSADSRIDDESSTDGTEEGVSNSVSMKDRNASSSKRNRRKERASSPKNIDIDEKSVTSPRKKRRHSGSDETIDIDEKPKISSRKAPKAKRSSAESDTTEEETVCKIESHGRSKKLSKGESDATPEKIVPKTESQGSSKKRSDKNTTSISSHVNETPSDARKTEIIKSLKVEKSSKDKKSESPSKSKIYKNGLQHDKTVDGDDVPDRKVLSPKKHTQKNKILDSETEEASEIETKPGIRVKKKKKTKVKNDEDAVEEPKTLPSNGRDFEFVKPDIDACMIPSVKCKRKRRRDVDDNDEEAPDSLQPGSANEEQNNREFFRDVRIKVEPDPSDVEDTVSGKSTVKRKNKRAKTQLESEDERFGATTIKTEPDASDLEDGRPSKKKSKKRRSGDGDSLNGIKIKAEPNASDVEGSVVLKSRLKSEPNDSKIKVDRENRRV